MADKNDLFERLNLQLSELEILRSMFVDEKELIVDQDSLLAVQDFISGLNTALSERLNFTLSLTTWIPENDSFSVTVDTKEISSPSISSKEDVLEVSCFLPHNYPEERPEVCVNCNSLSREAQKELNSKTRSFLESLETGELCIVTVIQWLQENWVNICE